MSDPLSLVPLAAAARGGRVDTHATRDLVAAGVTLLQRCAPLVRALDGHRAAILLPTSPAFLVALAASDGRGTVLINPLSAPAEVAQQIADANVGAVFTIDALQHRLPGRFPRVMLDDAPGRARVLIAGEDRAVDLGSHLGLALEGELDAPGRDEEAVVVFTSAMAGMPLGAILTHRNLLANARAIAEGAALNGETVSLAVLPFAYPLGFTASLMAPLIAGGRVVTTPRFSALRSLDLLRTEGVTLLVGVPAVFAGLLAALDRDGGRLEAHALRVCITGGAPLDDTLQARWHSATGVELRQSYGLTEAAPVCLFNAVAAENRRGTLGAALPGVEVAIRDEEICVRGDNVFRGYIAGGDAGLALRDGWLHTGDRGVIDADGYVTFTGVAKPMFTRNGFNVYPREIERVVGAMPGVRSVVARAIPEPTRGNDIALEIAASVTPDEVRRWCEAKLSEYKRPSRIEFREE